MNRPEFPGDSVVCVIMNRPNLSEPLWAESHGTPDGSRRVTPVHGNWLSAEILPQHRRHWLLGAGHGGRACSLTYGFTFSAFSLSGAVRLSASASVLITCGVRKR